jgi:hypothetical protein
MLVYSPQGGRGPSNGEGGDNGTPGILTPLPPVSGIWGRGHIFKEVAIRSIELKVVP